MSQTKDIYLENLSQEHQDKKDWEEERLTTQIFKEIQESKPEKEESSSDLSNDPVDW